MRFDEAGPDGLLRTSALLRYAQDLAGHHSAERGFTRAWYAERGLLWLARAAEVGVLGSMRVGDEIVGTTRVVGWRRVWARRRTDFIDGSGRLAAWTHVDWVLLDGRGSPTRIPPEFDAVFGAPKADFPLGRVPLDGAPADARTTRFRVRPQELDPMDHANNAVYADWLEESVIGAGGVDATRAIPGRHGWSTPGPQRGSELVALTWPDALGWSCRISGEDGTELLRARLAPPD
ncbi:MAG: acyl-ACP thioesterase domain-containing protein [Candidatus Limnocylindrales bacterium]